jgi:hypothetical protein
VEELEEGEAIEVNTWAESQSVQLGDAFIYVGEVIYDPEQVSGVDESSLDDNVDLEPFEIREITDVEFDTESGSHVYQRQYEIQLISGSTEYLYEFSPIVVRYELVGMDGYAESSVMPESIYITTRLNETEFINNLISNLTTNGIELNSAYGEIEVEGQNGLTWVFLMLGGILGVLAVIDLAVRVVPEWKEEKNRTGGEEKVNLISCAYRTLRENKTSGAKPRILLHQKDHLMRVVMAEKEGESWLAEPDVEGLPDEVRELVMTVFENCREGYVREEMKQEDIEESLKQVESILKYYYPGEMSGWKS